MIFNHHIILKVFNIRQKHYHLFNNAKVPNGRHETGPYFTECWDINSLIWTHIIAIVQTFYKREKLVYPRKPFVSDLQYW